MRKHLAVLAFIATLGLPGLAQAADVFGVWLTESGRTHVEIYRCTDPKLGAVCGRVVWLIEAINPDKTKAASIEEVRDTNNTNQSLRGRKLLGMDFMRDFKPDPDRPGAYIDGHIYNAEDGDTYSAKLTLQPDDKLVLRGYVLMPMLGKSQTWTRIK